MTDLKPIEEMTLKEIKEELEQRRNKKEPAKTLYGYKVEELIVVVEMLNKKYITPKELDDRMLWLKAMETEIFKYIDIVLEGVKK